MSQEFRLSMFVIYTLIFEAMIWGGFGFVVFALGNSGWWMALAVVVSSAQMMPERFGVK